LAAVVDDLHLDALLHHLGDLVERHVPALDRVVELPVGVALDDLRLANGRFGFTHDGGPLTQCAKAVPPLPACANRAISFQVRLRSAAMIRVAPWSPRHPCRAADGALS